MIVADASALLAIMFAEPERERFLSVLQAADHALVSIVSVVEARRVIPARAVSAPSGRRPAPAAVVQLGGARM